MPILYAAGFVAKEFAWCIFMIVIAALQHQYFGGRVGSARSKHKVDYPTMYVEAGKSYSKDKATGQPLAPLTEESAQEFNRYQRVHGNNCEIIPMFYVLMVIAGLSFPVPAAVFGGVWIFGRGMYAYGYYQGVSQRNWGSAHYLASLGLLGLCVAFGIQLLREEGPYYS